jgi:uncharacterized protein YndB with AHSA1/START domain
MSTAAKAKAEHVLTMSRVYPVSRQKLWDCIAKREHLEQWWGPKGCDIVKAKLDFRPGGIFHYGMAFGTPHVNFGRWAIREIVAPEKLVFISSFSDENAGLVPPPFPDPWPVEFRTTFLLEEVEGGTKFTVFFATMPDAPDEQVDTFEKQRDSMKEGWTGTLERLEAFIAKA